MKRLLKILSGKFRIQLLIIAFFTLIASLFSEHYVSGNIRIVDGDTLIVNEDKIRLYGIDAPEIKQKCYIDSKPWNCGLEAKQELENITNNSKVKCITKYQDRYQRTVAICYVGTVDISREMVRRGYSIAYREYSKDYIAEEEYAKVNRLGIWKGSFVPPNKWRKSLK